MRYLLASSPPWVSGLVTGAVFAIITGTVRILMGDPVVPVLVSSVFAGAMFAVVTGSVTGRHTAWMLGKAVDLPPEILPRVIRASSRGPVPDDHELRTAAWQLAARRYGYAKRMRTATVVIMLVMAAVSFGAAATLSWWFLPTVGFFLLAVPITLWNVARLARRVRLLEPAPATP